MSVAELNSAIAAVRAAQAAGTAAPRTWSSENLPAPPTQFAGGVRTGLRGAAYDAAYRAPLDAADALFGAYFTAAMMGARARGTHGTQRRAANTCAFHGRP